MYYTTTKKKNSLSIVSSLQSGFIYQFYFLIFVFVFPLTKYYSLVFRVMCLEWSPTRIQMHTMSEYKIS